MAWTLDNLKFAYLLLVVCRKPKIISDSVVKNWNRPEI